MSGLYCIAKERWLKPAAGASLTLNGASIVAALIKTSYDFTVAAQTTSLSASLALASRATSIGDNASSVTADEVLTGTTISSSNGVTHFDATDAIFESISSSQTIHGILFYHRITDDTDSIPIAFINIATVVTNGSTLNINWDNGVNRIFSIT